MSQKWSFSVCRASCPYKKSNLLPELLDTAEWDGTQSVWWIFGEFLMTQKSHESLDHVLYVASQMKFGPTEKVFEISKKLVNFSLTLYLKSRFMGLLNFWQTDIKLLLWDSNECKYVSGSVTYIITKYSSQIRSRVEDKVHKSDKSFTHLFLSGESYRVGQYLRGTCKNDRFYMSPQLDLVTHREIQNLLNWVFQVLYARPL